ncbi:MAG TPA: dTDP-4-dehydrorhamnose reductase [Parvibaculum sp.]
MLRGALQKIEITTLPVLSEVKLIATPRFADSRGHFSEIYSQRAFSEAGIDTVFVQDNYSLSTKRGTLRGLHFQTPPFEQAKLVRVARGRILDVVVDIRHGSPTYGLHDSVVLSSEEGNQLFVPAGFAHGLVTLEDDTEVVYKVSNFYSAAHDGGLLWSDPALNIDWRLDGMTPALSDKDQRHPVLADLPRYFTYEPPSPDGRPVLIIGHSGQVARALNARGFGEVPHVLLGRDSADLADAAALARAFAAHRPRLIVNAGAYTAVDKAESEPGLAFAVNRDGPAQLAALCAAAKIPLIHISTDYVFDGSKADPYCEDDPVAPLGVYGASKAAGEAAIRARLPEHVILRTSWVYSSTGNNFVKTMLRLGAEREALSVVDDQRGSPTSAADLAEAIGIVVARLLDGTGSFGTFHCCGSGETNWYDFAREIFARAAERGQKTPRISAIRTRDYPTPAQRPANSRLDGTRIAEAYGIKLPAWEDSLGRCMEDILRETVSV